MLNRQAARRIRNGVAAALLLVAAPAFADGSATPAVPEPEGYRLDEYKAPTPATITGGTVVSTEDLQALLADDGVILIDVLPERRKPDNLPASTLWFPKPRHNIPGSVWLPDVGRGELSEAVESYFRSNLERLTGGDKDRKLVFYCLADCWMSWNAAKRAIGYGYGSVHWYPEGTDGWAAAGLPLEKSEPAPLPDAAAPPA